MCHTSLSTRLRIGESHDAGLGPRMASPVATLEGSRCRKKSGIVVPERSELRSSAMDKASWLSKSSDGMAGGGVGSDLIRLLLSWVGRRRAGVVEGSNV